MGSNGSKMGSSCSEDSARSMSEEPAGSWSGVDVQATASRKGVPRGGDSVIILSSRLQLPAAACPPAPPTLPYSLPRQLAL